MELMVNTGKGYVQAPKNKSEDAPLGLISMNSCLVQLRKFLFLLKIQERKRS